MRGGYFLDTLGRHRHAFHRQHILCGGHIDAQSGPLRRRIGAWQAQVTGDEALHAIVEPVLGPSLFFSNLPDGSAQKGRIASDDRIHVLGGHPKPPRQDDGRATIHSHVYDALRAPRDLPEPCQRSLHLALAEYRRGCSIRKYRAAQALLPNRFIERRQVPDGGAALRALTYISDDALLRRLA